MLTNTPCLVCTAVPKNYKAKTFMYTLNLKAHQDTVRCSDIQQGSIPPLHSCALCPTYLYISQKKRLRGTQLLPDVECQR